MKNITYIITLLILMTTFSCSEEDFAEAYPDPSKIAETTVEKQFTGFLFANKNYVVPEYRNYFVTLRTTINRYNQITGWVNETGQYIPGSSGTEDVWFNYYNTLAQFRELEKVYNSKTAQEQQERKVFMLAAQVYLYDYTHRMVDLFGNMPFSEAGFLSTNGGEYQSSYAKFDSAEEIYTFLISDLKRISGELSNIELNEGFQLSFQTQDYVNSGDVESWQRYCNSLRLRILNRVSGSSTFGATASAEISEIFNNPQTFPVVENNEQNIQIDIFNLDTPIRANFGGALESGLTWYINTAGMAFIDQLTETDDPRLPILFQPGESADGEYIGIDPLGTNADQSDIAADGKIAIFNRSTFSFNQFFPGILFTASEISLIKAEAMLRLGDDVAARVAYESAITESLEFYTNVRELSNDSSVPFTAPSSEALDSYIKHDRVSWAMASSTEEKLQLIAKQKWVHFNIVQPYENWAENRRLDALALEFQVDNANDQTLPPVRWTIPGNEITFNPENYAEVSSEDNLNNSIFWDL